MNAAFQHLVVQDVSWSSFCSRPLLSSSIILAVAISLALCFSQLKMRTLLTAALAALGLSFIAEAQLCSPYAACNGTSFPALVNATLDDLQNGLTQNLFTSVDLVNAYTDRINEANGTLSMVTELNPDAVSIARELDEERKQGKSRGPLHGIPVLIKNNIATNDQMNNTAGSFALLGAKVPTDSTIAAKLRQAGAIILGKSVCCLLIRCLS